MRRREDLDVDEDANLCIFCYPPKDRTILYEDENVYVMPCLGHFKEGYLLLISKEHEDCFASLMDEERVDVKDKVREVLKEKYGACCFYEHGQVGACLERGKNKICYHAHIHCVPIEKDFTEDIEKDFDRIEVENHHDLQDLYQKHSHYLYLETDDGIKSFFPVENGVESQYLRKKACQAIGLPKELANWKENPQRDKMKKTGRELKDLF